MQRSFPPKEPPSTWPSAAESSIYAAQSSSTTSAASSTPLNRSNPDSGERFWNPNQRIAWIPDMVVEETPSADYVEGDYDFVAFYKRLANLIEDDTNISPKDSEYSDTTTQHSELTNSSVSSVAHMLERNGSQTQKGEPIKALDWTYFLIIDSMKVIGGGGFGDVCEGIWRNVPPSEGKPPRVVIKKFRISGTHQKETSRKLRPVFREIAIWHILDHPNIVPFVGVYQVPGNIPCLVSEWMRNGNVNSFIGRNPSVCLHMMLLGVASGLQYLHDSKIVHGDMKGDNVLVNARGDACLCDFGLSRVLRENFQWNTSATHANGTTRWMSPELLLGEQATVTFESDIYGFGMTCYEIMKGDQPFHGSRDGMVYKALMEKKRPPRDAECITNSIWNMIESCWAEDPKERLSMPQVLEILKHHICGGIASQCVYRDGSQTDERTTSSQSIQDMELDGEEPASMTTNNPAEVNGENGVKRKRECQDEASGSGSCPPKRFKK